MATARPTSILIQPSHGWVSLKLSELWASRELIYFLAWRDIKVRYKQTAFGVAWAVIQPLFQMIIFSVIFGRLAKLPSEGVPYPIFAFAALLPWQLFAHSLSQAANSLVASEALIKKVYFPRLVIPIASVIDGLADFAVALIVLFGMMAWYGFAPTPRIVLLPLLVLFAVVTALAVGLWLSALNVRYRDVRYTLPFLTQLWLFATPVAYSSTLIPAEWRGLYALNPMVGVVEGFRWVLLGHGQLRTDALVASVTVSLVLLFCGLAFFRRVEKSFADVL